MIRFMGLVVLILGCDGGRPGGGRTDSESHWLEACTTDAECGNLRCLCGVCSQACGAEATCEGVAAEAVCLPSTCAEAPMACTRACTDACGAPHLACTAGACVSAPPAADAAPVDMRVPDASTDMRVPDMRVPDMRVPDADQGVVDAQPVDAQPVDAQPVDVGVPDGPTRLPDGPGCLADVDCPGGVCQAEGHDAQDQLCGRPAPAQNVCPPEACALDGDCGLGQRCILAGQYGHVRSACVPARCREDADCADRVGGRCLGFFTPCQVAGFACAADEDPCRVDSDCPQRGAVRVCLPREGGGTTCVAIE